MKSLILAASLIAFTTPALLAAETIETGYTHPEALAVDPATGDVYISVVGELAGRDGDGFIARVANGAAQAEIFVDGLNGPKGSQIHDGKLYVVEVGEVLIIDLETRQHEAIAIPEAGFLLDLSVSEDGTVYVTDTPMNTVYQIVDGEVSTFIQDDALGAPNGIYAMPIGDIMVAGWGVISDPNTWETSEDGRLTRISSDGVISEQSEPLSSFDGLTRFQDGNVIRYIATSFNDGQLYASDAHLGHYSVTESFGEGIADIAYHDSMAYLINFNTGVLHIIDMGETIGDTEVSAR